jgi:hypothetical protein
VFKAFCFSLHVLARTSMRANLVSPMHLAVNRTVALPSRLACERLSKSMRSKQGALGLLRQSSHDKSTRMSSETCYYTS